MPQDNFNLDSDEVAKLLKAAVLPMSFENFFPLTETSDPAFWQKVSHGPYPDEPSERVTRFMRLWDRMLHSPGAYVPHTNKILIRGDLPPSILASTLSHECVHFLKANGIIERDIPIAAAWGYFKRWTVDPHPVRPGSDAASQYFKQENWTAVLENIKEGRILARTEDVAGKIDGILAAYDDTQEEDEISYRWGAIIAGIAIELHLGTGYISQLARGKFHQQAVRYASEMR